MKVIENKFYSKDSVDKTAIIFVCSLLFQAEAVLPTWALSYSIFSCLNFIHIKPLLFYWCFGSLTKQHLCKAKFSDPEAEKNSKIESVHWLQLQEIKLNYPINFQMFHLK